MKYREAVQRYRFILASVKTSQVIVPKVFTSCQKYVKLCSSSESHGGLDPEKQGDDAKINEAMKNEGADMATTVTIWMIIVILWSMKVIRDGNYGT